jgi:uncharacterized protein YcbK (DUF882 family)
VYPLDVTDRTRRQLAPRAPQIAITPIAHSNQWTGTLRINFHLSKRAQAASSIVTVAAAALLHASVLSPAVAEQAETFHFDQFKDANQPAGRKPLAGRSNLGADFDGDGASAAINWQANAGCLNSDLKSVLAEVVASYGPITVNSTCRSASHNAAIGGAEHSYHLNGNAVDFRVHGNVAGAAAFLSGRVGGYKHSGGGLFHIDTGPRRAMN